VQARIKIKNGKELWIEVLVDSGCTHTGINKQLVKDKKIQTRPINFSFIVYNVDKIKNGDITKVVPLEVKINRHKEHIEAAVIDLNGMDVFLEHDCLVKHNPEVNWKDGKIWFTRCPGSCKMKYQDIEFKTKRVQIMETNDKDQQEIEQKPDPMNTEDLPNYIQLFTHLFNKKKFKKLLERQE